ncbi:NADH-quinone oxidoreductase subunit 5 family protein [Acidithiobacillus sulfurivorans]|uniref:NADH-quinone oxidoreductase subunit L n=1 Tax=Acidithiobacillus sulfurivorans TaxID=1958756 RepID=A0ABS5ZVA8_9PROT|nr:proton-conducting transporter membrane subunit [Acidithiobacillus sulfurivorans]MBU2759100.1 NADH-quinone oxidoreductase subunit L [Acidithiobacillus sulfurivorans]
MGDLAIVIPFLPILSAAVIFIFMHSARKAAARISVIITLLTFILALIELTSYALGGFSRVEIIGTLWGSVWLDPLTLIMWSFVCGISLLVHMYSVRYMVEEANYTRFFALLDLMTATILFMVSAADLITLLVAWFLVGVVLYFLLGHDTNRPAAGRYAFWTQITYRAGDVPLWLAAFVLIRSYHSISLPVIFSRLQMYPHLDAFWGLSIPELVGFLLAFAAFARSAQFLLHGWLPYTMDGPTPVSALMHAGIVNAGGFLFNRFFPVFEHASIVLHFVFIVGLITAVVGSAMMLIQNDVKRSLGYSTMGQMGFMVMECGVGAFALAVFHLIAHGFFKASLFLGAGNIIGEAREHDGVPPDSVYTSIVERRPAKPSRLPWLAAAALTIIVPVVVLSVSHLFVSSRLLHEQGVIILLFFGWVTGAQALFATHKMTHTNPWRLMGGILGSFVLVVIGYTLISHYFGHFLYPHGEGYQLYSAASINSVYFDVLVIILALLFVGAWALTFFADSSGWWDRADQGRWRGVYLALYALLSRELYVNDLYARMTQVLLSGARRLNVLLRWC